MMPKLRIRLAETHANFISQCEGWLEIGTYVCELAAEA